MTSPEAGGRSGWPRGRCQDGSEAAGARRAALRESAALAGEEAGAGRDAASEGKWPPSRKAGLARAWGPGAVRWERARPRTAAAAPARVARELAPSQSRGACAPGAAASAPGALLVPVCGPVVAGRAERRGAPTPARPRFHASCARVTRARGLSPRSGPGVGGRAALSVVSAA